LKSLTSANERTHERTKDVTLAAQPSSAANASQHGLLAGDDHDDGCRRDKMGGTIDEMGGTIVA